MTDLAALIIVFKTCSFCSVVGVVGADRGLALKIDDGGIRAFSPLLVRLLQQCDMISEDEVAELGKWASSTIQNWDVLVVGRVEMTDAVSGS